MRPLYKISSEINAILDEVCEDGVIPDEIDMAFSDFKDKATAIAAYILNLRAELTAVTNAANEMKKREKALAKKADDLQDYLLYNMNAVGFDNVSTAEFVVKIQKNRDCSVVINDISMVPADMMLPIKPVEPQPDKNLIKKAILSGINIDGCDIQYKDRISLK